MANKTFAQDLTEMMVGWSKIEAAARAQFPKASEEELHRITSDAMKHALGVK